MATVEIYPTMSPSHHVLMCHKWMISIAAFIWCGIVGPDCGPGTDSLRPDLSARDVAADCGDISHRQFSLPFVLWGYLLASNVFLDIPCDIERRNATVTIDPSPKKPPYISRDVALILIRTAHNANSCMAEDGLKDAIAMSLPAQADCTAVKIRILPGKPFRPMVRMT